MKLAPELPVQELRFYDEQGRERSINDDPAFQAGLEEIEDCPVYCREIDESLGIESPPWFRACEQDARWFLETLGFDSLKPIQLLAEGTELDDLGFDTDDGEDSTIALTNSLYDKIYVRQSKAAAMFQSRGVISITAMLVHELAHDTAHKIEVMAAHRQGEVLSTCLRTGFVTLGLRDTTQGLFFEEGFAHFMAGWYVRTRQDNNLLVVSRATPSTALSKRIL
jgi:hypothetical protein